MSCIRKGLRSGLSKATAFSLKMMIDKVEETGSFDVKIFQREKSNCLDIDGGCGYDIARSIKQCFGNVQFPEWEYPKL